MKTKLAFTTYINGLKPTFTAGFIQRKPIPVGPANYSAIRLPQMKRGLSMSATYARVSGWCAQIDGIYQTKHTIPSGCQAKANWKAQLSCRWLYWKEEDGTVTQPRILCSVNPVLSADAALCEEALRIVSIMPKWKPGHQHGVNLKVKYTFPIKFEIPVN